MKFMCLDCDEAMALTSNDPLSEGRLQVVYACASCGRRMAMVTNPGETQMVRSLGVQIGHESLAPAPGAGPDADVAPGAPEPMSTVAGALEGGAALRPSAPAPVWSDAARRRLEAAPGFVQGMVRRLYEDWAIQNGIEEITPEVMTRARKSLGMEGM